MKRILLLDCPGGIAGDMLVAALLDLGADETKLRAAIDSLELEGYRIVVSRVSKNALDTCDFNVILDESHENHDHNMAYLHGATPEHDHHHHEHAHRTLSDVAAIIAKASITPRASELALGIFTILADAEAHAHGATRETVHFHEVGALDSIIDIVSVAVCCDDLGIDSVYVRELCEGCGTVRCAHGLLPIPVPAVSWITREYQIPLRLTDTQGELVTPTGAACIAALRSGEALMQPISIIATGLGAGKRTYPDTCGFVRAMLAEYAFESPSPSAQSLRPRGAGATPPIMKLECDIDDAPGEMLANALQAVLEAGAYEAHYLPIYTKKNRCAWQLQVICAAEIRESIEEILFAETTTIGIRRTLMERTVLERCGTTIETAIGTIAAKQVVLPSGATRLYPEFESVRNAAQAAGITYHAAYRQALAACAASEASSLM